MGFYAFVNKITKLKKVNVIEFSYWKIESSVNSKKSKIESLKYGVGMNDIRKIRWDDATNNDEIWLKCEQKKTLA